MIWRILTSCFSAETWQRIGLRKLVLILVVVIAGWQYGLKRPLYQHLYGKPDNTPLVISTLDAIQDIPSQPEQIAQVGGMNIRLQLMKQISTTARVVYVDRYSWFGTWYRSRPGAKLYDKVVPLDLSLTTGQAAQRPSCFEFTHEYRCLLGMGKCSFYDEREISNNHTIPANSRIKKGLEILKAGDVAHIEGYLVYWQGTGPYAPYRFESAVQVGQVSPKLHGGQRSILCRQLFLTKLTFDGYTFE